MRSRDTRRSFWKSVGEEIANYSYDTFHQEMPEVDLLVAIIISQAEDWDDDQYFDTNGFEECCYLLNLHPPLIRTIMLWSMRIAKHKYGVK